VRVWDPLTGIPVGAPLTGHDGGVNAVAFGELGDGRAVVVSGGGDGTVRVWDLAVGAPVGSLPFGHTDTVNALATGIVDGRAVAVSGSSDRTVRVWDLATGARVGGPFTGHEGGVNAVAFGELDGRAVVVSGSADKTVRLWDPATGAPVGDPLTGHTGGVRSVACGQGLDGRLLLATGGDDQTVRIWQPAVEPPTSPAANQPPRNVYISYSHQDERYARELETYLAPLRRDGLITTWTDRQVSPGQEWRREIEAAIVNADLILLLVSPDFLASDFIVNQELPRMLARRQSGSATVVPIILRPADWQVTPLGSLQALPGNGRPVSVWPNRDQAWLDIAEGLQRLISSQA
jgi:WD40 repeat protein